jgi:hypothetical protein
MRTTFCEARGECKVKCGGQCPSLTKVTSDDGGILTVEALNGHLTGHKYVGPTELRERNPIATCILHCVDGCVEIIDEQGCADDIEAIQAVISTHLPAVPRW